MASIDTSRVAAELRRMIATSNGIRKEAENVIGRIEQSPASFEPLDDVPEEIANRFANVTLRKAKIINRTHDFRIVFAHWVLESSEEHCDFLLVFRRKRGYQIDWEWVDNQLTQED